MPNTLISIEDYAFYCCYNLADITIPFQVSEVGNYLFDGCINLKTINLPESLKDEETKFSSSSAKIIYYNVFWNVYYIDYIDSDNIFHLFASEQVRHKMNTTMNFATMKNYDLTDYYTGEPFDGIGITANRFIKAIKRPTITYTGDYIGEETIECGNDVTLPTPPEGYIYTFTVNGEEWDGTNITSDVTVTVKKIKLHTITFTGDYTDTITVPDGENAELPYNGYDYKYKFTVNGEEWDGTDITSDVTVTVKKVNVYHVYSYADSECDFYREVEENEDVELPEKGYNCRYVYMRDDEYEWDGKNVTSDIYLMIYKYDLVSSGKCGDNINYYLYDDGLLSIEGTGKMTNYSYSSSAPWRGRIKKVSISDGITSIGDYAFYSCTDLTSITIPDGVTSIGDNAFYDCDGLENIILPDSVTTIYSRAFESCSNLSDIKIPNAVTSIGDYAFRWCGKLTSIFIPANVATIGDCAFGSTEINVDAQNKNYSSLDGVLFNKDRSILVQYPTGRNDDNYIIPNGVVTIADEAFAGSSLCGIVMPNSVTTIYGYAFAYCSSLGSTYGDIQGIVMSDNIVRIGADAFKGTYAYNNDMQDGVLYIGDYCVASDLNTVSCIIKDGTKLIADDTFRKYQSPLTSITIPDSVKYIGSDAFSGTAITDITIPDSVTSIGDHAFDYCSKLSTVYFTGTESEWIKLVNYCNGHSYLRNATVVYISKYTFEANGGSAVSSVTKEITESPVTTCEGKTFLGWYDNAECSGTAITFPYSGEKTTLYAKWGAKVTFVGDLADEETVACGQDISLPTPPTGYTYSFTANGEKWDGTNVTENITVTVTKIPNKYTVTYVGDYAGTDVVNYSENATLPTPPEGYAYKFTVNGEPWDGTNITSEVTVTVTKLHDKCEIVDITDCYGIEVNSNMLTASTYFGSLNSNGISVSDGAAAKVYANSACSGNPITDINTTGSSTTTVYVVVTAESGRSVTYTAKLTRTPVTSLGKIEFTKATGEHITLRFKDPVPGNPKILVATSKDGTNYTYSEAEYDPEELLIQLSGLEGTNKLFRKSSGGLQR